MLQECTPSNSFFTDCFIDLESQKENLSNTEYQWAKTTIKAVEILSIKKDEFSTLLNEGERNEGIHQQTGLIVEIGFIPGKNENELKSSIECRVNLLRMAYLFDKKEKETFLFFRLAFMGPPCFNGRMITLQHYVSKRQPDAMILKNLETAHSILLEQKISSDLYYKYQTSVDQQAVALESYMYEFAKTDDFLSNSPPDLEDLIAFSKKAPEVAILYDLNFDSEQINFIYERACEFYVR